MASKKKIRDALLVQLKNKGADLSHFVSLVDDYVFCWEQEKAMQKDIKTNGSKYIATSSAGKMYEKENSAVKNAILYNKQMLVILKELGLCTDQVTDPDDDEL
ncbi:MAG: P27 family phage terminase small subunit [Acetanaerobacterium sp.]